MGQQDDGLPSSPRARDGHARQFHCDLDATCEDRKKRKQELGLMTVSLPPTRTARKQKSARKVGKTGDT